MLGNNGRKATSNRGLNSSCNQKAGLNRRRAAPLEADSKRKQDAARRWSAAFP